MNRRQFLRSAAAGILAAPALLRSAAAQEGPFRVKYYPVAAGMGSRDTTPAPDGTIWFCGQRNGTLGRLDPRDGSYKLVDLGKGAAPHGVIIGPDGAPWVTEGGQNAIARVDPGDHKVTLFRLPEKEAYANLNTAVFDKQRHLLVHRPIRHLWPARPEIGRHDRVQVAARARHLRHDHHAEGRHLVRLARRQPHRQDRPRDRQRDRGRAADAEPGRATGVVGFQGPDLGQRMEQRQRVGSRSRRRFLEGLEAAGQQSTRPMPSMSTTRTRSGSPISAPTRSCASIP